MYLINAAICDDDKEFADRMEQIVAQATAEDVKINIIKFYDGFELVRYCKKNPADMIILDIDMPATDGFTAVEEIRKLQTELNVIFVTSHDELAYQAYDYQPFWFVSKSELDKLDGILKKLVQRIRVSRSENRIVRIKSGDIVDIDLRDAMYLSSRHNNIEIHGSGGDITEFRGTVTETYRQLKEHGFVLIQRGLIANCRFIKRLLATAVILKDGTEFAVARDKKKQEEAQAIYGRYMRDII